MVEAKPLANIKATTVQKFFWQNIVCRFRVPRELTVDNGKQFDCYTFKEYCKTLGTQVKFSSVYHPQSNRAVERANGLIFSGIKKCLFDQKKGKWVDELPKVAGLTTPQCREQQVSRLFAYFSALRP
jgi:transposase InsO family protein